MFDPLRVIRALKKSKIASQHTFIIRRNELGDKRQARGPDPLRQLSARMTKNALGPAGAPHAAFDPFAENPRRIDTVAAHLRSSSAIGLSQSASKVCEGPIAVITTAIDPE